MLTTPITAATTASQMSKRRPDLDRCFVGTAHKYATLTPWSARLTSS